MCVPRPCFVYVREVPVKHPEKRLEMRGRHARERTESEEKDRRLKNRERLESVTSGLQPASLSLSLSRSLSVSLSLSPSLSLSLSLFISFSLSLCRCLCLPLSLSSSSALLRMADHRCVLFISPSVSPPRTPSSLLPLFLHPSFRLALSIRLSSCLSVCLSIAQALCSADSLFSWFQLFCTVSKDYHTHTDTRTHTHGHTPKQQCNPLLYYMCIHMQTHTHTVWIWLLDRTLWCMAGYHCTLQLLEEVLEKPPARTPTDSAHTHTHTPNTHTHTYLGKKHSTHAIYLLISVGHSCQLRYISVACIV